MTTIQDQLAWEQVMVDRGIERFRKQQDNAVIGSRAHETSAGSTLLRAYVQQVSEHITLYINGKHPGGRRRNKYAALLGAVSPDKTALFTLTRVIGALYDPQTVQAISLSIGRAIEDELRFCQFQAEYKEYYDALIRSWETKRTRSRTHKRNTLSVKSRDVGMEWADWDKPTLAGVGALALSLAKEVCDLIDLKRVRQRRKQTVYVVPSEQCVEWVGKHNEFAELTHPDKMPTLVPPADWVSVTDGGYYSPEMRSKVPFILGLRRSGRRKVFSDAQMPRVFQGANALQRTGWQVNTRVLETVQNIWAAGLTIGMPKPQPYEIPPCPLAPEVNARELPEDSPERAAFKDWKETARDLHTLEEERQAKARAFSRTVRLAVEMKDHAEFFYVYQADFRARFYAATTGLSPQGDDVGKGMLQFSSSEPLGEDGLYWLKVHGANKYGEDKCSYDARVQWIEARHKHWLAVSEDPVENRDLWKDADKPFQFLAFCFEYAEAHRLGDKFRSRLPIALDGSCNGLQHFSAMLRDEVGGAAVNLTPSDAPADIYNEVGGVCTDKLRALRMNPADSNAGASNWLAFFGEGQMSRALAKKPVMTLPYGSTQRTCVEAISKYVQETNPKFFPPHTNFRHALYLAPLLWSSISEVVIAARAAMTWLQDAANVLAKAGHPILFYTPLGFPMRQASMKYTLHRVDTQIDGRLQIKIADDSDALDARKQRQGSSPNFVHASDATHMTMCINSGVASGITSFAMIHDDFGVHARFVAEWHKIIRSEFVALHKGHDLLKEFKEQHERRHGIVLPPLPNKGSLELDQVMRSPYFFG